MARFKGKVAIVTGAGQGIGETYARRLAREGARVVVAELNAEQGARVAGEINAAGREALFVKTDVSSEQSVAEMVKAVVDRFGAIHLLVNNAAIFNGMKHEPLTSVDLDYYRKFMAVNMDGALLVTRAVVPHMVTAGGGAIVNQSSTAAYMSGAVGAYYGISKLATNGLTTSLAVELGPKGIRVNAIAPGPTDTEAMRQVDKAIISSIVAQMPLARLGTTDDIANALLFLLSDDASWITGQVLCVDGGMIRRG